MAFKQKIGKSRSAKFPASMTWQKGRELKLAEPLLKLISIIFCFSFDGVSFEERRKKQARGHSRSSSQRRSVCVSVESACARSAHCSLLLLCSCIAAAPARVGSAAGGATEGRGQTRRQIRGRAGRQSSAAQRSPVRCIDFACAFVHPPPPCVWSEAAMHAMAGEDSGTMQRTH